MIFIYFFFLENKSKLSYLLEYMGTRLKLGKFKENVINSRFFEDFEFQPKNGTTLAQLY